MAGSVDSLRLLNRTEFHSCGVICHIEALQDLGQKHLSESDSKLAYIKQCYQPFYYL